MFFVFCLRIDVDIADILTKIVCRTFFWNEITNEFTRNTFF